MSDWAPGDRALCIKDGACGCCGQVGHVNKGAIYTVVQVFVTMQFVPIAASVFSLEPMLALTLEGVPAPDGHVGYAASCFTKIEPYEPDAEDLETIDLLNKTKIPETVI